MFSFPVMKTSLCFTDVKIIAVPATGFVNDFGLLRTILAVLVSRIFSDFNMAVSFQFLFNTDIRSKKQNGFLCRAIFTRSF